MQATGPEVGVTERGTGRRARAPDRQRLNDLAGNWNTNKQGRPCHSTMNTPVVMARDMRSSRRNSIQQMKGG